MTSPLICYVHVTVWVSSGCFGFLPHSKDTQISWLLYIVINVYDRTNYR